MTMLKVHMPGLKLRVPGQELEDRLEVIRVDRAVCIEADNGRVVFDEIQATAASLVSRQSDAKFFRVGSVAGNMVLPSQLQWCIKISQPLERRQIVVPVH